MASFLVSRSVRPIFSAIFRPFVVRSATYTTEKGQAVTEKGETSVDTAVDSEEVSF